MITANIGSNTFRFPETLEEYFQTFSSHVIGLNQEFDSPYGKKKIIYADWTASGRLYQPIEEKISVDFGPFMANTHTESNITSLMINRLYKQSKQIIKEHVNADTHDIVILDGFCMKSEVNKI